MSSFDKIVQFASDDPWVEVVMKSKITDEFQPQSLRLSDVSSFEGNGEMGSFILFKDGRVAQLSISHAELAVKMNQRYSPIDLKEACIRMACGLKMIAYVREANTWNVKEFSFIGEDILWDKIEEFDSTFTQMKGVMVGLRSTQNMPFSEDRLRLDISTSELKRVFNEAKQRHADVIDLRPVLRQNLIGKNPHMTF